LLESFIANFIIQSIYTPVHICNVLPLTYKLLKASHLVVAGFFGGHLNLKIAGLRKNRYIIFYSILDRYFRKFILEHILIILTFNVYIHFHRIVCASDRDKPYKTDVRNIAAWTEVVTGELHYIVL
jgi:hypothetical protein